LSIARAYRSGNEAKKIATSASVASYHPIMLGKLTIVTVVIAALEFLTRCVVEVASLQAESAARRLGD